jgi:hypothetical protein
MTKAKRPEEPRCGERLKTTNGKPTRVPCARSAGHSGWHASATALRNQRKNEAKSKHGYEMKRRYGITEAEYWKIHAVQGGVCFICQRATGATKRLSCDHDHKVEKVLGVRASVRGLLCLGCNRFLGHARDDAAFFARCADYLQSPPARAVLDVDYSGEETA